MVSWYLILYELMNFGYGFDDFVGIEDEENG
jgi:hypothetical protein